MNHRIRSGRVPVAADASGSIGRERSGGLRGRVSAVRPKLAHLVRRARRTLARREFPVVPAHLGRIDYDGAEIVIGVTSRAEIMSRLTPVAKEPWTVRWLEQGIRDGDVFYDIGANVGTYSLIAAAQQRSAVRV